MISNPLCPYCGSNQTELEFYEISDDSAYLVYFCECERSFARVYEYAESRDENDDRIEEELE